MKKYLVKNISNKPVYRANTLFLPNMEKEVYLNDYHLFQIKVCVYLKVEEIKETVEVEKEVENVADKLVCKNCGKEYQAEHHYKKHVEKCGGDNK